MESQLRLGRRVLLSVLLLAFGITPLGVDQSSASVSPCPLRDPGPDVGWVRVPKDFDNVLEAVYIAAERDLNRVWIGPGIHPLAPFSLPNVPEDFPLAGLYLDESFIICGMGPDLTIVSARERVRPPLIMLFVDGGEVVLEGFTLTGGGWEEGSAIPPGLTVRGKGSRFILRNLRVFDTEGAEEISISADSEVLLERVMVHGDGLYLGGGKIVISRSLISGNWDGIFISWDSEVTIVQSRISGNRRGIVTDGRPRITILESEISYNGGDGIKLGANTYLEAKGNRIFANGGYGIRLVRKECGFQVDGSEGVRVEGIGNEIFDNAQGDLCPEDYPWPAGFKRP